MEHSFALFIFIGFLAQTIDGALGMAYGVTATSALLSMGMPPALASASVHMAEVVTTGVSGLSHRRLGNVDAHLLWRLAVPGVIGGMVGAYLLTELPGEVIRPFIATYLLIMGLIILRRAFASPTQRTVPSAVMPLGLVAGFLDAIGGGGWGPIATATLVARGSHPRYTIGSVNLSEFFVTFAQSATFLLALQEINWSVIAGLMIGGLVAAPFAAYVTRRLPARPLLFGVGILVILLSTRSIYLVFGH